MSLSPEIMLRNWRQDADIASTQIEITNDEATYNTLLQILIEANQKSSWSLNTNKDIEPINSSSRGEVKKFGFRWSHLRNLCHLKMLELKSGGDNRIKLTPYEIQTNNGPREMLEFEFTTTTNRPYISKISRNALENACSESKAQLLSVLITSTPLNP